MHKNDKRQPLQPRRVPVQRRKPTKTYKIPFIITTLLAVVLIALFIVSLSSYKIQQTELNKLDEQYKALEAKLKSTEIKSKIAVEKPSKTKFNVIKEKKDVTKNFELNKPIILNDCEYVFTNIELIEATHGRYGLKFIYNFKNNKNETVSANKYFILKAYQDGVETDRLFYSDINYGIGQKNIKPSGEITDAEDLIGLDDINKPVEIELIEARSRSPKTLTMVIDDPTQY